MPEAALEPGAMIGVVGGTGPQGKALAYRFAAAGRTVVVGSRSRDRAEQAVRLIRERLPDARATAAVNGEAAEQASIVLLAIPWDGHAHAVASLRAELAGKVVISCVNPLGFDEAGPYGLTLAESAAEEAQRLLPESSVVGAFHHVSAVSLWKSDRPLHHEDVLVCGEDPAAKAVVQGLAVAVTGKPGIDAGKLRLARQLEPLTAVLISMNKLHRTRTGVAVAGIEASIADAADPVPAEA